MVTVLADNFVILVKILGKQLGESSEKTNINKSYDARGLHKIYIVSWNLK